MKFRYKNPTYLTVLIVILSLVQVAMIFINVCKFCNWFHMYSLMPTLEIIQLILSVLILITCILLLTLTYTVDKKKIRIKFGFIDVTRGNLTTEKILSVVKKTKEESLFINVFDNGSEPVIIRICIYKDRYDEFVKTLLATNENITYFEE